MRSNIIIAGVPRAGKSTLARRIAKRFGYQHISMDAIIAGFEQHFPALGINTYAEMPSFDILRNISEKIAPFVHTLLERGAYDESGKGTVLDVYQLLPKDYMAHIGASVSQIHYLVTAEVSASERFQLIRKHDTPSDYSYHQTDRELAECCEYMVEQSRYLKQECEKYGLPFHETSADRERVFEEILGHFSNV